MYTYLTDVVWILFLMILSIFLGSYEAFHMAGSFLSMLWMIEVIFIILNIKIIFTRFTWANRFVIFLLPVCIWPVIMYFFY